MQAWAVPAQGLAASSSSFGGGSQLVSDGANAVGLRNGTNAQTLSVYNTYTAGTPDYERLELTWSSNIAVIRSTKNGTGIIRALRIDGGGGNAAILFPTANNGSMTFIGNSTSGAFTTGALLISASSSATSGNNFISYHSGTYSDGGTTSTTVVNVLCLVNTINYTAASRTGKVVLANFAPTLTSIPSGQNAGISFSSALNASTFQPIVFNNVADEDTNYEKTFMGYVSNTFVINTTKGGSGTNRNLALQFGGASKVLLTSGRLHFLSGHAIAWDAADSFGTANPSLTNSIQSGAAGVAWTCNGTLSGSPADFNLWTLTPTLAGAFTVTRLNYFNVPNVAGAATVTDAAVLRFDAAVGTHKATAANAAVAVTLTSVGPTGSQTTVQGWMKINVNGTLRYIPFW